MQNPVYTFGLSFSLIFTVLPFFKRIVLSEDTVIWSANIVDCLMLLLKWAIHRFCVIKLGAKSKPSHLHSMNELAYT